MFTINKGVSFFESETHYSLKEMETFLTVEQQYYHHQLICRKPTTLWKRWKLYHWDSLRRHDNRSRKPTTLWKRWKLFMKQLHYIPSFTWSETHYSLKEMETNLSGIPLSVIITDCRKPTTLWKRWKHLLLPQCFLAQIHGVGNPLLSERGGSCQVNPLCGLLEYWKHCMNCSDLWW